MKKISHKIFLLILLPAVIMALATLLAAITILPQDSESLTAALHSPLFIIPWILLFLLIFLYPIFCINENKIFMRYLRVHLPMALLALACLTAFLSTKRLEFTLRPGQSLTITEIYQRMGLKGYDQTLLELENFTITENEGADHYISSFRVQSVKGLVSRHSVTVNQPFSSGTIRLYQKNGGLAITDITIGLEGREISLFETRFNPIRLGSGDLLTLQPVDMTDGRIEYQWILENKSDEIIGEGRGFPQDKTILIGETEVIILEEIFTPFSVLEAVYSPANLPLTAAALLFLGALFFHFWGRKLIIRITRMNKR